MIEIYAIGKNKDKALSELEKEYIKRISPFSKIKENDFVILLDLHGKMMDSLSFSKELEKWQSASSHIVFVIAGSLGPSQALIKRANIRWKLSDLTFTHLMTRVLILEQIYRGFMILNGRSYHK